MNRKGCKFFAAALTTGILLGSCGDAYARSRRQNSALDDLNSAPRSGPYSGEAPRR